MIEVKVNKFIFAANFKILKKTVITSLLIAFSTFIYGQDWYIPETFLGIKGGMSYSFVDFSPSTNEMYISGLQGGLVFRHNSEKFWGTQIEVNYIQSGWAEDYADTGSYSRQINYLEVPVLTRFHFGNKNRVFVNAGPAVGFYLDESENIELDAGEMKDHYEQELNSNFNFSIDVGLGYSRKLKFGTIEFEVRYKLGLSNIFEISPEQFESSRHQQYTFSLYYFFWD